MSSRSRTDLAIASMAWIHSSNYIDMTFRQAALLSVLCDEPGPHRVTELARRLAVDKTVVSRAADMFDVMKLARRVSDPDDRRGVVIGVTALGRSIREAMKESP
jgi:DNA-binding MarR family transcriptional regulator